MREPTIICVPHYIEEVGPAPDGKSRLFEVKLMLQCPLEHNVLDALQDMRKLYSQLPEGTTDEHDETIGGGTDTILG